MAQNLEIDYLLKMLRKEVVNPEAEYDPLVELAKIAKDPETAIKDKIKCNATIAQYIHAQKKSVEVNGNLSGDIELRHRAIQSIEEVFSKAFSKD